MFTVILRVDRIIQSKMWQRIQDFLKDLNKDPKLEELLRRNREALEKQRQEAQLPSHQTDSTGKNPNQTGRRRGFVRDGQAETVKGST